MTGAIQIRTFEDLCPGEDWRSASFLFDEKILEAWDRLFPGPGLSGPLPLGLSSVIVMRGLTLANSDAPQGGVHGGMCVKIHRLPEIGDEIVTSLRCIHKELRKGRRWVTLEILQKTGDGTVLIEGSHKVLWGA